MLKTENMNRITNWIADLLFVYRRIMQSKLRKITFQLN